jgi:hypothetical protein
MTKFKKEMKEVNNDMKEIKLYELQMILIQGNSNKSWEISWRSTFRLRSKTRAG